MENKQHIHTTRKTRKRILCGHANTTQGDTLPF